VQGLLGKQVEVDKKVEVDKPVEVDSNWLFCS
jgi:hypothetical protein